MKIKLRKNFTQRCLIDCLRCSKKHEEIVRSHIGLESVWNKLLAPWNSSNFGSKCHKPRKIRDLIKAGLCTQVTPLVCMITQFTCQRSWVNLYVSMRSFNKSTEGY